MPATDVFADLPFRLSGRASWLQARGRVGDAEIMWNAYAEIIESRRAASTPADADLCKFYGVSTDKELIAAQARHIEKLQAKLPKEPSSAPKRVREG